MNGLSSRTFRGVYPWHRAGDTRLIATDDLYRGKDTQFQINACLNCSMTECVNCVDHRPNKYKPRTKRTDKMCRIRERFLELFHQGMNIDGIVSSMHISRGSYYNYKKKFVDDVKGEKSA